MIFEKQYTPLRCFAQLPGSRFHKKSGTVSKTVPEYSVR